MTSRRRFWLYCLAGLAVMVVLLRLTRFRPKPPELPSTDISQVASWHLTGWRLVEGKQVPWDIWGQHSPTLRYEQLGASTRLSRDESSEALTPARGSYPPYYIRGLTPNRNNPLQRLIPFGQGEPDPVTNLPRKFQVKSPETGLVTAELTATYNTPLPEDLQEPPIVSGLQYLSLGSSSELGDSPPNTFTTLVSYERGVTTQVRLVEQDAEGNLHLQLRFSPGPPDSPTSLPLRASGDVMAIGSSFQSDPGERVWLGYPGTQGQAGTQNLYLVRKTPLKPGDPRTEKVRLRVMTYLKWAPELYAYFRETDVKQGIRFVEISRPAPPSSGAPSPRTGPDSLAHWCATLRAAEYRGALRRTSSPTERQAAYEKALFWYDKAIKTASQAQRELLQQERERLVQNRKGIPPPRATLPGL